MASTQPPRIRLTLRTPEEWRAILDTMSPEHRAQVSPAWLARMQAAVQPDPWLHGFNAVDADGTVVGTGAFKAPPADGVVEIAYAVDDAHQGRGYATEIAAGLVDFAFTSGTVQRVTAHTLPDGMASQRVLVNSGFRLVGPWEDPEDGTVLRFELDR